MVRTRTRDLTTGLEDRLPCDGSLFVTPLPPSQLPSDQNQLAALTQQVQTLVALICGLSSGQQILGG